MRIKSLGMTVLMLVLSVSCDRSEDERTNDRQEAEDRDTTQAERTVVAFDTLSHTDKPIGLEYFAESDSVFKNLFDPVNWSIAYDSEAFSVVSSKCETCWNDHDYAPFKVADTILYIFRDASGDTLARIISLFDRNIETMVFSGPKMLQPGVFHKEFVINNPGIDIDNWLKIGISVTELEKRLGAPNYNNGKVIHYERATDHIWFLAVRQKKGKVTSIRIGHYYT